MPEPARVLLFDRAAAALRPHIADLLRAGAGRISPSTLVGELETGIDSLFDCAPDSLGVESRRQSEQLRQELVAAGAPETEAALVADLYDLDGAVGIAGLSHRTGVDTLRLAAAFVAIGGRLGLDWAQGKAARMNPSDPWERLLVAGLARDFQQMRLGFVARVAQSGDPEAGVARWTEAQAPAIAQFRATVQRAQGAVVASPSMLAQLAGQARSLLIR
jgi:glutamate dehydrogenase